MTSEKSVVRGRLDLGFEFDPATERTRLKIYAQQPPLRVVRGFDLANGAVLVHLHNLSGGVLGGDQLELKIEVGSGAQAQLTSAGATRLYRSRNNQPASQLTEVRVQAG